MTSFLFFVLLKLLFVVALAPSREVAGLALDITHDSRYPVIHSLIEFSCSGSGDLTQDEIAWMKDGQQIAEWPLPEGVQVPSGYRLSEHTTSGGFFVFLEILSMDVGDNGEYRCQLQRDSNVLSTSNLKELAMEQSPSEQYPECSVRTVGEGKVFICESETSRPPVSLQWWRDGQHLEQPVSQDDTSDFIKVLLPVDEDEIGRGRFECSMTFKEQHWGTCLLDRPNVAITTSTTDLSIGQKLDITCIATGNPTPIVSWSFDRDLQAPFRTEGSVLHVYNISAQDDGIEVKCEGQNALGSNQTGALITLRPHQTTAELRQIKVPVSVGELAQFRCRAISAISATKPDCIWHYKGVFVDPANTTDRFIVEDDSEHVLTIASISVEDVGASVSCLIMTSNRPSDRLLLSAAFPLTTEAMTLPMIPVSPKSDTSSNALNINLNSKLGYILGGLACLALAGVCCLVILRAKALLLGRRVDRHSASVVCNRLNNGDFTVDLGTSISPTAESCSPVTKELLVENESPYQDLDEVSRQQRQNEYQRLISNIWMPPPVSPAFCHET